jgi:hypothetical protein
MSISRRYRYLLGILVAALLAIPAVAVANGSGGNAAPHQPGVKVAIATDPGTLAIATGQCAGSQFTAQLTNTGKKPVYADATLAAPGELSIQRSMISTYLPAGYTRNVVIPVSAALGTKPGTYPVTIKTSNSTATLPVTVSTSTPDPSGNLARSASKISASSSHAGYPVCGAVDGDTNSDHWATTTGWNDGTSGAWPDWFELDWSNAQTIGRVDMFTLNSTKYPAAKYGLKDYDVQVLAGDQWTTVAAVRGNSAGEINTTFTPVQTTGLRVLTQAGNGADDYSRIVELEAFSS